MPVLFLNGEIRFSMRKVNILYMSGFVFPALQHAERAGHARWLAAYSPQNGHVSLGLFLTNGNGGPYCAAKSSFRIIIRC